MKKKFYEKPDITVINVLTEKSIFTGSIGEFYGEDWTDEDVDGTYYKSDNISINCYPGVLNGICSPIAGTIEGDDNLRIVVDKDYKGLVITTSQGRKYIKK